MDNCIEVAVGGQHIQHSLNLYSIVHILRKSEREESLQNCAYQMVGNILPNEQLVDRLTDNRVLKGFGFRSRYDNQRILEFTDDTQLAK